MQRATMPSDFKDVISIAQFDNLVDTGTRSMIIVNELLANCIMCCMANFDHNFYLIDNTPSIKNVAAKS